MTAVREDKWQSLRILILIILNVTILLVNQLQWGSTMEVNTKFSPIIFGGIQLEKLDGSGDVTVEEVIWQATMA